MNSDKTLERAHQAVEKNGLNWRSFWCGPKGTSGEIPSSWNVRGWPTVVLIDHEGKIAWRGHFMKGELKQLLEELVKRAEAK